MQNQKLQQENQAHLASDFMLHKALPADEFQINSCTLFAPEENM